MGLAAELTETSEFFSDNSVLSVAREVLARSFRHSLTILVNL